MDHDDGPPTEPDPTEPDPAEPDPTAPDPPDLQHAAAHPEGTAEGDAAADDTVTDVAARGDVVPVDLRDYVVFDTAAATRVRTMATDDLALDQWCIEPQQSTGVMQFPRADVAYTVIGGRSWFVTEQGEIGLDPLGSLLVPAGTVHGIDNRGSDPLIVLAAISPPDTLETMAPEQPANAAVRDDAQYGRLGRALSERVGRLLGRD